MEFNRISNFKIQLITVVWNLYICSQIFYFKFLNISNFTILRISRICNEFSRFFVLVFELDRIFYLKNITNSSNS